MQKLNPNSRTIIAINTIHSVIDLFINTFLVAYFLHLTGNDAIPACLFYIFNYTLVGIGFILLGNIVKCGNKLFIYRTSFIANALLLFAVIYLKEDTAKFIWILGFISGLEKAMFFAPQNLIISQEIFRRFQKQHQQSELYHRHCCSYRFCLRSEDISRADRT